MKRRRAGQRAEQRMATARLNLRLPSELMARLQDRAAQEERSVSQLARLLLRRALDLDSK